jgi:hypothetical protein
MSLQRGYFQPAFVRRLVTEHISGKRDLWWRLVVFEHWHQRNADAAGQQFPFSALAVPSTVAERRV